MARYNGNVEPFASLATGPNRTVFGDTVQSDDINLNLNQNFKKGWEIVGANSSPTKQDFNALGFTMSELIAYLYQMGVAEYNALQKYVVNSHVIASDGNIYKSLTGSISAPNVGNDPLTSAANWENILLPSKLLSLIKTVDGAGSGLDADLLDGKTSAQFIGKNADGGAITLYNVADLNNLTNTGVFNLATTGTLNNPYPKSNWAYLEVIRHVNNNGHCFQRLTTLNSVKKTFTRRQVAGTWEAWQEINSNGGIGSGLDADLVRGLPADFTSSKAPNGYQKLPSGLIIQWGTAIALTSTNGTQTTVTFNIVFPTKCVGVYPQYIGQVVSVSAYSVTSKSQTMFTATRMNYAGLDTGLQFDWIAIGY